MSAPSNTSIAPARAVTRRVLHVGCGTPSRTKLHAIFQNDGWREIRLDIDPAVKPELTASIVDMRMHVEDASCDAIWSSHNIEHLAAHEVRPALREFRRVLTPSGFALIRCPDLTAIAEMIVRHGADHVVYISPAGPITPLDMLYGHGASIATGNPYMRHGCGFTQEGLGRALIDAGFDEARATRTEDYTVWALALNPDADADAILAALAKAGLDFNA